MAGGVRICDCESQVGAFGLNPQQVFVALSLMSPIMSLNIYGHLDGGHKLLISLMRPARLERATFWFVAGKWRFSATSSFLLAYSSKSTYGVLSCLELSENISIFQFSASVSASVKPSPTVSHEEEV